MAGKRNVTIRRYGAAELFGKAVEQLPISALRKAVRANHKKIVCPFKPGATACHKKGGVCSLVRFQQEKTGPARIVEKPVPTKNKKWISPDEAYEKCIDKQRFAQYLSSPPDALQ